MIPSDSTGSELGLRQNCIGKYGVFFIFSPKQIAGFEAIDILTGGLASVLQTRLGSDRLV